MTLDHAFKTLCHLTPDADWQVIWQRQDMMEISLADAGVVALLTFDAVGLPVLEVANFALSFDTVRDLMNGIQSSHHARQKAALLEMAASLN